MAPMDKEAPGRPYTHGASPALFSQLAIMHNLIIAHLSNIPVFHSTGLRFIEHQTCVIYNNCTLHDNQGLLYKK